MTSLSEADAVVGLESESDPQAMANINNMPASNISTRPLVIITQTPLSKLEIIRYYDAHNHELNSNSRSFSGESPAISP